VPAVESSAASGFRRALPAITPDSAAVAAAAALSAVIGTLGGDLRWLAALGAIIVRHGSIPNGVPFATAPSTGWPNVPVASELILHGLQAGLGSRGLLLAQVIAVAVAFGFLARDMRAAAVNSAPAAGVLLAIVVGTFGSLAIVRAEVFSLALFPILVFLIRSEARRPSQRIWLLVPLLAVWSNLHGAALVGLAVACVYLVTERARTQPFLALGVLAASLLAVCATAALWRTPSYYAGVLENEAARSHFGLWSRLSLESAPDVIFLVVAVPLLVAALRTRPRLWELLALVALTLLTAQSARGSVWLAFFVATPAALRLGAGGRPERPSSMAKPVTLVLIALAAWGLARGPGETERVAGNRLLTRALALAGGTPVLATPEVAEQVALAGGKIWIGNPIDAFPHRDQRLYLDWLRGRRDGDAALGRAPRAVLVATEATANKRLELLGTLREVASDDHAVLYAPR
jgi:hypothetical protein